MTASDNQPAAVLAAELDLLHISADDMLELYHHILLRSIEEYGGLLLTQSGADIQAEFPTPGNALRCAASVQKKLSERSKSFPEEAMKAGIGIHMGEVMHHENGAAGEGPSTARRLRAACRPGGILVSEDIARRCSEKTEYKFESAGGLGEAGSPGYVRTFYMRPAGPGRARHKEDAPIDPEEIRDYIMSEIKRAGRRIDGDWLRRKLPADDPDIDKALNWLVDRGFLDERVRKNGRTGYSVSSGSSYSGARSDGDPKFLRYRKKIEKEAKNAMPGFRAHLTTYLVVNAGLVVLNVLTSRGFPWCLFPIGGWGIGLFTHYVSARVTEWKKGSLTGFPISTASSTAF